MKPTFLEGFAKVNAYPYGNSFLPREKPIVGSSEDDPRMGGMNVNALEPVALENTISGTSMFERSI